ncbi:MAG: methylisocitrate lyase [Gammaproteobacteria bacterium]|nr:methylisocitrate lyase [Gammaproteobacteria bacterium]MCY4199435.1 methylisocitrate lyase [Gammaproteobacteria bacterium]MCY4278044.1 methylisocitrate lyase [Gammaproteobacteria bacterium]MCY4322591.1 methylisocitrate lyase [Gammaproteobacteria bacterium]
MPEASAGKRLKAALDAEKPLQIAGTVHAYAALLAETAGFRAIYLSGAGVANASIGVPDLAITSLDDVLIDIRRITGATDLPLLVDADTGFGGAFNIARTVREFIRAGAAGLHIEDQVAEKRCGHRPGKAIVSIEEMQDRIRVAADAKTDPDFMIMARTDALAVDGFDAVIERAQAFEQAGADAIFAEAMTDVSHYGKVVSSVNVPVLANLTEFGLTPMFHVDDLREQGIAMALYPLSAFRAMNKAALAIFTELRTKGTQRDAVQHMQTREELYEVLRYHDYERQLDQLLEKRIGSKT